MMHRVLVVDDMPIFREPIAASIRRAGYVTFTAADGREALALVRKEKPELILLDVAMPVMNGLECLKALRADPETRNVPVIMLTAMAEQEPVAEALKIGIQGYLLKSQFSLEDMLSRIAKVFDKTSADPEKRREAAKRNPPEAAPQEKARA